MQRISARYARHVGEVTPLAFRRFFDDILLYGFGLLISVNALAVGESVEISAINGNYDPGQSSLVQVAPGDVVRLSADIFDFSHERAHYGAHGSAIEDFIWRADNRFPNECYGDDDDCLSHSDFETTSYGVDFFVPFQMTSDIRITVGHRNHLTEDTIILRNALASYGEITNVVASPVTYAQQYPSHNEIVPEYYLAGHGRWMWIDGEKYFVPDQYVSDWAPYQNGYWNWTAYGWTWISYDPWGEYTDHYGYWRRVEVRYGVYWWVWRPFPTAYYHWHAHTVTFVYGKGYIGWYPFYGLYSSLYSRGYEHGFVDGFWLGYALGSQIGAHNGPVHDHGYSVVEHRRFGHHNVRDVLFDRERARERVRESHDRRRYGKAPFSDDLNVSRRKVDQGGAQVSETSVERVRMGGREIEVTRRVHETPEVYKGAERSAQTRLERSVPVSETPTRPRKPQPTNPDPGRGQQPNVPSDRGTGGGTGRQQPTRPPQQPTRPPQQPTRPPQQPTRPPQPQQPSRPPREQPQARPAPSRPTPERGRPSRGAPPSAPRSTSPGGRGQR